MKVLSRVWFAVVMAAGVCSTAAARDGWFLEAGQASFKLKGIDTGIEERVLALPYIEGVIDKSLTSRVPAFGLGWRSGSVELGLSVMRGVKFSTVADPHVSIWDYNSRPLLLIREAYADLSSIRAAWYPIRLGAAEPYVAAYQLRADGYARASIHLGRYSVAAEEKRSATAYTAGVGALYSLGPVTLRSEVLYLGKKAKHLQVTARAHF